MPLTCGRFVRVAKFLVQLTCSSGVVMSHSEVITKSTFYIFSSKHTAQRELLTNLRVTENLALNRPARHSAYKSYKSRAAAAVDGDYLSVSCTGDDVTHPWWAVDLGQQYRISHVTITTTSERYRKYRRPCFVEKYQM